MTYLLLILFIFCLHVCGGKFNGVKREEVVVTKSGSLGVRLGSDFKVLEVVDPDSLLQLDDRITAINSETITDYEFYEFKSVLGSAKVPFVLSIERLNLDRNSIRAHKENAELMSNNKDIETESPSLAVLGNQLGLHLPVVSVKGGKSVDLLNVVSKAADFSGIFTCEFHTLVAAFPADGCRLEARDQRRSIYKNSIVVVKRGVCPFATKALTARDGGAMGVIIINSEGNIFPVKDPQAAQVTIPVVMVSQSQGKLILDMVAEGVKRKSRSSTSRIAPLNACLGARQRETQLKDQALTHSQKEKQAALSRSTLNAEGVNPGEAGVHTLNAETLKALAGYNEQKEKDRLEKREFAMDAHWISKSSQGSHGFDVSRRQSARVVGTATDGDHSEGAAEFGILTLSSSDSENSDIITEAEYVTLQGRFDSASGTKKVVYVRLPYHSYQEVRGGTLAAEYVTSLTRYYDEFGEMVFSWQHELEEDSESQRDWLLVVDCSPLSEREVVLESSNDVEAPGSLSSTVDTLEALGKLSNLLGKKARGLFLLSFPDDMSPSSYSSAGVDEFARTEFYNWSFPILEKLQHAVVTGDSLRSSSLLQLPIALIPSLKSSQLRRIFNQHISGVSTLFLGSLRPSSMVRAKWVDLWGVAAEVSSLPDERVRKKILHQMKLKYSEDEDVLLYLTNTLQSKNDVSHIGHPPVNRKAAAQAVAATMRAGGHAMHMARQIDIEKETRRSVKRKEVQAAHAEARESRENEDSIKSLTDLPVHSSRGTLTGIAVTGSAMKELQHPAGEL